MLWWGQIETHTRFISIDFWTKHHDFKVFMSLLKNDVFWTKQSTIAEEKRSKMKYKLSLFRTPQPQLLLLLQKFQFLLIKFRIKTSFLSRQFPPMKKLKQITNLGEYRFMQKLKFSGCLDTRRLNLCPPPHKSETILMSEPEETGSDGSGD